MSLYSQEDKERVMREVREWQAKKGIAPTQPVDNESLRDFIYIRYARNSQDLADRVQDFHVVGNLSKLKQRIEADSEETGCLRYTVLIGEDDRYPVWRDQ